MVLPLLGVMAMESGEVSPFVDEPGAANGASLAYAVHLLAFFTAFYLVLRARKARPIANAPLRPTASPQAVDRFGAFCLAIFSLLTFLMVFAYGGIGVLTLEVDKGEFRTSLGRFGALMTLSTKWFMPAMFAAYVRSAADVGWSPLRKLMLVLTALCLAIVGASWGFKTTVVLMLLPAVILVSWRLNTRVLAWLGLFFVVNVVAFSLFFDQHEDLAAAFEALALRLTALQGDLAWYTWEKVSNGAPTPDYLKTYLPVLGDGMLRQLTGADPSRNFGDWASYYFGNAMTIYGGYPIEGVQAGTTNQPTMFAEALVVGGKYLFFAVSAVFGGVAGLVASSLRRAIALRRHASAATLATFFSFTILSWTLGNGFSSLFYLINLVGAAVTYLMLRAFLSPGRFRRRPLA
jgi:hypothetical protein